MPNPSKRSISGQWRSMPTDGALEASGGQQAVFQMAISYHRVVGCPSPTRIHVDRGQRMFFTSSGRGIAAQGPSRKAPRGRSLVAISAGEVLLIPTKHAAFAATTRQHSGLGFERYPPPQRHELDWTSS